VQSTVQSTVKLSSFESVVTGLHKRINKIVILFLQFANFPRYCHSYSFNYNLLLTIIFFWPASTASPFFQKTKGFVKNLWLSKPSPFFQKTKGFFEEENLRFLNRRRVLKEDNQRFIKKNFCFFWKNRLFKILRFSFFDKTEGFWKARTDKKEDYN
jgi:hypothetical protein